MINSYLQKYSYQPPVIATKPKPNLGMFVVIPCFDEPNLIDSLQSLYNSSLPSCSVEVITVINASENATKSELTQNQKTYNEAIDWANTHKKKGLDFYFIQQNQLPKKHAGVGLARKVGMDEAIHRLGVLNMKDAPILCFDADSTCAKNYLKKVKQSFDKNPNAMGASIYFEHPLNGNQFSSSIYNSIIDYELHLRYYKNAFEYTNHPHACFTIGSSMAVRASAYQSQGGMNKRKAGEDFYFMQKIIERYPIIEINSTCIFPSPRPSHRVPFGTGRAISEFEEGKKSNLTYAFDSFEDLRILIGLVKGFYEENKIHNLLKDNDVPISIRQFLIQQKFEERISDLLTYGKTWTTFKKRFYNWFNAFRALKFIHFARDSFYPDTNLETASQQLFNRIKIDHKTHRLDMLLGMREYDKAK